MQNKESIEDLLETNGWEYHSTTGWYKYDGGKYWINIRRGVQGDPDSYWFLEPATRRIPTQMDEHEIRDFVSRLDNKDGQ